MGIAWVPQDPYSGLAESARTSNQFDLRDAVEWTAVVRRTSGVTDSVVSFQVSNDPVNGLGDAAEATFSDFLSVTGDSSDTFQGTAGYRYGRIIRDIVSGVSQSVELNKQVRN